MQLANQTFYFSVLIVLLGLMAGFLSRHEKLALGKQILYWPLSLFLLTLSIASFFAATWGSKYLLAVANISLVGGVISIGILFRSWRNAIRPLVIAIALCGFLIASISYLYLLNSGSVFDRIRLMNGVLVIISCWQLAELVAQEKHDSKAYQIKVLIGIEIAQILSRVLRSAYLSWGTETSLGSLYQENAVGFSLRVISILLLLSTCILITNYYLEKLWQEQRNNARAIEDGMLQSLNALSLVRDNETGNHILRTQQYVRRLALGLRALGVYTLELTDRAIDNMEKATPLHDIGKVGIPDDILKKKGSLDAKEWSIMKTHAALGERVLKSAKIEDTKHAKVLDLAIQIAGSHHENWDGSGYPRGLSGIQIPLSARIMALADMYDALVTERVYKRKWSHEEAREEILKNRGKRFDPAVVDAFVAEEARFLEIAAKLDDPK
jgi:hypothetical protein